VVVVGAVVVVAGSVVVVVVSGAVVVGVVVDVVVVVEVVVVELVVVEGSVVVVADAEVVVVTDGPYDQTYSGPGSPKRHASQSAHVGHSPAARSASGCSIGQLSVLERQQVNVAAWALPGHRRAADTVAAGITHRDFIRAAGQGTRQIPRRSFRALRVRQFRGRGMSSTEALHCPAVDHDGTSHGAAARNFEAVIRRRV